MFGCCSVSTLVILVALYKFLDWFIRKFYLGGCANRYILVTGCDTGFGNLLVKRLDSRGCHVFAGCLTESGETELKKTCSDRVVTLPLDVSKHDSVLKAKSTIESKLPRGKGLWGVMNNAGILGPCGMPDWQTIEDYKKVNSVNLYGVIDVSLTMLPLIKRERGRIVNTSSIFGRYSLAPTAPYSVSKYGVQAFTDALRRSFRWWKIKAILIEPGLHKTHITSTDNMALFLDESWQNTPPEIQKEYGREFFDYTRTKAADQFYKMGSDRVSDVVDAYTHALLGRFPRARYVVGHDAKFLWLPIQWMPEWLGDWVAFNFDREKPKPASIK